MNRRILICSIFMLVNGQKAIYRIEEIIKKDNYTIETHDLKTTDKYMLILYRIPCNRSVKKCDEDRPVVFLMPGLMEAANSFILLGPEYSLAYILADAGYDVWLGNSRGNKNSRFHDYWDPDNPLEKTEFFNYSWEEIGIYDVAEMVDFILKMTKKQKVHYVAYGEGGTAFLVLNSMKPEYNEKFSRVHLLAAMGYQRHFSNPVFKEISRSTDNLNERLQSIGNVEIFPPGSTDEVKSYQDVPKHCLGNRARADFCKSLGIEEVVNEKFLRTLKDYETDAASFKEVMHYIQNIKAKSFRRWDYGKEENEKVYGNPEPPEYDLTLVTANVTLHYSKNDNLINEQDVLDMATDMPNAQARKVSKDDFHRHDFISSKDAKALVYAYIVSSLNDIKSLQ